MLGRIVRAKHAATFVGNRIEDYLELARLDAAALQQELLRSVVGFAVLACAGLLFLSFFSVAVIVTAWDTEVRILVAWLVCLLWALLGAAGLVVLGQALRQPTPFEDLCTEVSRDLAVLKEML
jgi:hypothetical protein